MNNGRNNGSYKHGLFGGWREYRYGSKRAKKVYDPSKKVAKPEPEYVKQVAEGLVNWKSNPWEKEAAMTHYLRRRNIQNARKLDWQAAEDLAEATVRMAFNTIGRGLETRPKKDEGQLEHTISEDYCLGCFGPLSDEDVLRQRRFCCDDCARLVIARRKFSRTRQAIRDGEIDKIGLAAYIELEKAKTKPRCCDHCGDTFRPRYEWKDQRFCSKYCQSKAQETIQPRNCKCCNKSFRPVANSAVYCSKDCEVKGRSMVTYERECAWCGSSFLANGGKAKFCCGAHAQAHHRATRGKLPPKLAPPVFDFLFAA